METIKDCPFCNNRAKLEFRTTEKEFRKEKFQIREFFYNCGSCGEEFTTTSADEVSVNQVYNQYREKCGIIFPEELIYLRSRYNLSAQKISQVLGLGINTYANYEKGEMPTIANSNLIGSAKNPETFLTYANQSKGFFSEKSFEHLVHHIKNLKDDDIDNPKVSNLNWYQRPNKYTGYSVPNIHKLSNLLLYLISSNNADFNDKLKLNKMLFYADFIHYKHTGKSITGLSYRAIPYGPAPTNYDYIFAYFTDSEKLIEPEFIKSQNSRVIECIKALRDFDISVFDKEELQTINQIITNFKNIPSWDLVELSHKERAWLELNESSGIVSYQEYAFDIHGVGE